MPFLVLDKVKDLSASALTPISKATEEDINIQTLAAIQAPL